MQPLMNPLFNVRQASKHAILLEEHLLAPRMACPDCLAKHWLAIEAYIWEAFSLDKDRKYTKLLEFALNEVQRLESDFMKGTPRPLLAQKLRELRKVIVKESFELQPRTF